jgi:hypothetical protein
MPIESASDRAVFVNPDDFGATAIYTPLATGLPSDAFAGLFDDPSGIMASDIGAGVGAVDGRPTFFCRADDLPDGAEGGDAGDALDVTGEGAFSVLSIEPDGQGMVLLRLGARSDN